MNNHKKWIEYCLNLAKKGAGSVSPNPLVGSVLVADDGQILGEGYHQKFGGPHAEVNTISAAERHFTSEEIRNATLYVNLEPCSHFGKTPPCSRLIVEKGIRRVVVGQTDPFPAVSGSGVQFLKDQGIELTVGVLEDQCRRLNEAFMHHVTTGRPLVTLKIASTLDGRIATETGHSEWVSGAESRKMVHQWRADLDAVLIGSGTALRDDAALTVRHVKGRQPLRVVLDRNGTLPADLKLFTDEFADKTIVFTAQNVAPAYEGKLVSAGGKIIPIEQKGNHLNLSKILDWLGGDGIQSLLVEAGPGLATALFSQDLVDRFNLFLAPKIIGSGIPMIDFGSYSEKDGRKVFMTDATKFVDHKWTPAGEDLLFQGFLRSL